MELDERKMKILKAIISTYLETGDPVGSRTIAKDSDLHLSSATIRNEMADLEELGYILQPHTSAGRIPSDLGYRYYVNCLMEENDEIRTRETEREKEHQDLINKMDRMEEVLKNVADVLAANTNYATLISAPQIKESKLKFIQLSMVDSRRLLVVIVVGNDTVKNVLMNMDEPLGNDEILKLNILLNSFLQGLTLNDINIELVHTMKVQAGMHADILEGVFNGIVEAIHEADNLEIYTSEQPICSSILNFPIQSIRQHFLTH
jgi:heat-inducible transcriptional repressor